MRRLVTVAPSILSASSLAAFALATLAMATVTALAAPPSAARRLLAPSPCTVAPTFEHAAGAAVGAEIPLTLTLKATCPAGAYGPLHISLLVQSSEEFARNPDTGENLRGDVQASLKILVDRLDLPNNPWIKLGLVQYNDRSQKLCDLTNDKAKIVDCINDLSAKGETRLDTAIKEAVNVLKRGRPGAGAGLREFVLLYSDGSNDYTDPRTSMPPQVEAALREAKLREAALRGAAHSPAQQPKAGCDSVITEVDEAKAENANIVWSTVCVKCDQSCLRRIATSQQFMGDLSNPDRLYTYFDRLADQMGVSPLAQLDVTATLGADISYVSDSGSPPPIVEDPPAEGRVSWQILRTRDSERIRWSVRAARPGAAVPLCSAVKVTFIDNRAGTGVLNLDCPAIPVTGGRPSDTPRPTVPPSATSEVQDTPSPTQRPTDPPSATPTAPIKRDIYLPVSFRQWPAGLAP